MIQIQIMKSLRHKYLAFTLIELLVSVAIISLLIVGALTSYTRYIDKQRLTAAAEKLEAGLKEAQNMARVGYLGSCDQLAGINLTSNSGVDGLYYEIRVICEPLSSQLVSTVVLDTDLSISSHLNVTFRPFSHLASAVAPITISSDRSNYYAIFEIDQGGGIKVSYF